MMRDEQNKILSTSPNIKNTSYISYNFKLSIIYLITQVTWLMIWWEMGQGISDTVYFNKLMIELCPIV